MASMHAKAVEVIKKPPDQRVTSEIDQIAPWLRRLTHVLQGLESEALSQILKNCDYLRAEKDEILIRQSEAGDCLYIILSGVVSVYVDAAKSGEEDGAVGGRATKHAAPPSETPGADDTAHARDTVHHLHHHKRHRSTLGKFILKLEAGKCFGEIALISEDSARNATIISDGVTDLLVIRKSLYDRTLKSHQEREFVERQEFVRTHPLFRYWPKRLQRLLEMSLVKEIYGFGAQLMKQGDPWNGLVFILSGRVKIMVEPAKHKQQYPDLSYITKNDIYALEFNRPQKVHQDHIEEILRWEHIEVRRTEGYAAAEHRRFHREVPLSIAERGEMLGDIESVCNLPTHSVSAICTAPTDVFVLTPRNFDRLVTKRRPKTLDVLRTEVEQKLKTRLESQHGSELLLYQHLYFKLVEELQPVNRRSTNFPAGKRLPDKDSLFLHLMTTFSRNRAEAVVPHVEGSVFIREKMREKARVRESVRQHQPEGTAPAGRKNRPVVRRPPSAKPRSVKHLKLALARQEENAEQSER